MNAPNDSIPSWLFLICSVTNVPALSKNLYIPYFLKHSSRLELNPGYLIHPNK